MNNIAVMITSLQIISLIMMIGTANELLISNTATIFFIIAFATFARCSIFISKHEKWLTRLSRKQND